MKIFFSFLWLCVLSSGITNAQSNISGLKADFSQKGCVQRVDQGDVKPTPFLECRGPAGYSVLIKTRDGRQYYVAVVNSAGTRFPLKLGELVNLHFFILGGSGEWRVQSKNGTMQPIAIILGISTQQDKTKPNLVTNNYFAVAKITPDKVCITNLLSEEDSTIEKLHTLADGAQQKDCLANGAVDDN